ncbi:MAG: transporter ATP-binding protein [Planctomycetaceae bacterium]|nr:transporter ATP-binding protein [Planctomycetaceae bacterium]
MKLVRPLTEPSIAVSCRGITRDFGDGETRIRVLHGIDLDIPLGEISLLVGPSGCGKTTLISIVCGLLEPTDGDITLFGESHETLRGTRLVQFRGKNIGFVFQQYNLLPALTAAENAALPLIIAGMPRRRAVAKARDILETVGLGNRVDSKPSQLSGGQQQRVAIARALVHEPRLLVCDEPTAALDAQSGQTVMELLRRVAVHPDRAVLVVTHDNRVFEYGDRIVSMTDGRIEKIETRTQRMAAMSAPTAEPLTVNRVFGSANHVA